MMVLAIMLLSMCAGLLYMLDERSAVIVRKLDEILKELRKP